MDEDTTLPARLAALDTALTDALDIADAECDDEARERLRELALRTLFHLGDLKLAARVEWWEGCHCHGSDRDEDFEAKEIEALAREMGPHPHVGLGTQDPRDRGARDHLQQVYWQVPLSHDERERLRGRCLAWRAYTDRIAGLRQRLQAGKKAHAEAVASLAAAEEELRRNAPDLTPEALARREEVVQAMRATVAARARAVAEIEAGLRDCPAPVAPVRIAEATPARTEGVLACPRCGSRRWSGDDPPRCLGCGTIAEESHD